MPRDNGGRDEGVEQQLSPLARAVADAISKFESGELNADSLRELARTVHYARPDLRNYEPAEQDAARELFAGKIGEVRDTLRRFEQLISPGSETEAMAALLEFVNTAFAALIRVDWRGLEKDLINLIYTGNRLAPPKPPARSAGDWLRIVVNLGWHPDEINDMLPVELTRDESQVFTLDERGFTTTTNRRLDRAQLRQEYAPPEEPWKTKFFERLPKIP
jgi:hypothetical protein